MSEKIGTLLVLQQVERRMLERQHEAEDDDKLRVQILEQTIKDLQAQVKEPEANEDS